MSSLPESSESEVVGITCSDLHFSQRPPVARSAEENWFKAQSRPLRQLRELQEKYDCPVFIAGDIFDRWNSPPELINFLLKRFPKSVYACFGQHDAPYHQPGSLRKSAYWTLVESGKLVNLEPGKPVELEVKGTFLEIYGFPWGEELHPIPRRDLLLTIAVIHKYIWVPGRGYDGAPEENTAEFLGNKLSGFDVSVWGDNHLPFLTKVGNTVVCNCGGFQRRRADEVSHRPSVWLIHKDGSVTRHKLRVSEDRFIDNLDELQSSGPNLEGFLEELSNLGECGISVEESIRRALDQESVSPGVKEIVLRNLEESK